MYYATVVAAAVHQFILRSLRDAVTDDQVVVQNVASGEFCVLFVALGPELARLLIWRDAVGRPRIGSGREPL